MSEPSGARVSRSMAVSIGGVVALIAAWSVAVTPQVAQAAEPNPDLAPGCGLDIAVVLDRFGTTPAYGTDPPYGPTTSAETMRDEVKQFIGLVEGSGARVSITSFAETATVEKPATLVDATGRAALEAALDGVAMANETFPGDVTRRGKSNWEAALEGAHSTFDGFPAGHPDMVLMMSTHAADAGIGSGTPADGAAAAADVIKHTGTRLYAVGAHPSSGERNRPWRELIEPQLQAIAGPDLIPTAPLTQGDYSILGVDGLAEAFALQALPCMLQLFPPAGTPPNPDLASGCGLDVALVVDRSLKGEYGNMEIVRDALHGLLDSLADTGARLSLASYSYGSRLDAGVTPVTTGPDLDRLHAAVDTIYASGQTNWMAGHATALATFRDFAPAGRPDLVLHVTNRSPNRPAPGFPPHILPMSWAAQVANLMKAAGAHVFVVGVTNEVDIRSMQQVSGPGGFPASPFGQADYTHVKRFGQIKAILGSVGTACDG